jgi:hypothetical protein
MPVAAAPGPAEDVTTVGWHVDDHETFDQIVARIADRGVSVEHGHDEERRCAASSGWCASPDRKAWSKSCTPRR